MNDSLLLFYKNIQSFKNFGMDTIDLIAQFPFIEENEKVILSIIEVLLLFFLIMFKWYFVNTKNVQIHSTHADEWLKVSIVDY